MTTSYHVRRARPSDRARILSLQPQPSAESGAMGIDDTGVVEALLEEPAPDLGELIAAGRYFVAETMGEQGGQIVAGVGWTSHWALGDVAMIRAIYVHPAHRDSGIARRLVEIAEDSAVTRGHNMILAPVPVAAVGLFEAMGYDGAGHIDVVLAAGHHLQRRKMWKHTA